MPCRRGYAPSTVVSVLSCPGAFLTLAAKRHHHPGHPCHRPLDVFGGAAADADGGSGGGGGGGGRGGGGVGGVAEVPGPVVGSRLSHLAKQTLCLSDEEWRDVPAGEFEVPPGAIDDVDVRLANIDDGQWWRGMLFKEVRLLVAEAGGEDGTRAEAGVEAEVRAEAGVEAGLEAGPGVGPEAADEWGEEAVGETAHRMRTDGRRTTAAAALRTKAGETCVVM